ncbi:MAG: class II histone deacetylase [Chloroflexota bacterium]
MTTGFVFHEKYLWHDTGNQWLTLTHVPPMQPLQHVESPETKRRFKNLLHVTEIWSDLIELKPRQATKAELLRVHEEAYIDKVETLSKKHGGNAGLDAPFGRSGYDIFSLTAGGTIMALDAVVTGQVDNAYALVRPPGHHALPDKGYGFCIFNNIAVAIRHAFATHQLNRIAVVDWDVHHGNGTEAIFYNESDVLTISIHQELCFPPNTGYIEDNGAGEGTGYNLNIPLPSGSGHGAYITAMEQLVVPALQQYKPDLIIVANGLDANMFDPMGRMMAWSETYRVMTQMMLDVAATCCEGRLVINHEGGYSEAYVPYCGLAVIETLLGKSSGWEDPYKPVCEGKEQQALRPHQTALIQSIEPLLDQIR